MPFTLSSSSNPPVIIERSKLSQIYALFALAMALTVLGVFFGMNTALLSSPLYMFLLLAELVIIFTSRWWVRSSPLNILLFAAFPLLSGLTLTPLLLAIIAGYANGAAIILNATIATALLALAAAIFARTTSWNLGVMGRFLFFALIGLLIFGLLQLFFPLLRAPQTEVIYSGIGIVIFALFFAYDVQRIERLAVTDASPFFLALSLYLDIYNLFLYILRFIIAIGGRRR